MCVCVCVVHRTTLTKTEKGDPPVSGFVSCPSSATERNNMFKTWSRSWYLWKRKEQLARAMSEPKYPVVSFLSPSLSHYFLLSLSLTSFFSLSLLSSLSTSISLLLSFLPFYFLLGSWYSSVDWSITISHPSSSSSSSGLLSFTWFTGWKFIEWRRWRRRRSCKRQCLQ